MQNLCFLSCPQPEIFLPLILPLSFSKSLVFFFVFFLICCHALLYGIDQDFQEASFGRGRMFIVGKERKIEEQLLFDIRGNPQI